MILLEQMIIFHSEKSAKNIFLVKDETNYKNVVLNHKCLKLFREPNTKYPLLNFANLIFDKI